MQFVRLFSATSTAYSLVGCVVIAFVLLGSGSSSAKDGLAWLLVKKASGSASSWTEKVSYVSIVTWGLDLN